MKEQIKRKENGNTGFDSVPLNWEILTLGDESIAELVMGQSPPSATYNQDGAGLPFFQGKAEFGTLSPTAMKWCSSPQRIAEQNDVLISVRAPVGDVNIAPFRCCIGRGLAAIRAKDKTIPRFIYFRLIEDKKRLERQGSGTTFQSINKNVLRDFEVAVPPLSEQRTIAAILSKIQDAIQVQERIIGTTKRLKKSLMAKLFTEGTLSEELKKTEIGIMPKSWEISSLGELAEIVYGAQAAVAHATDSSIGTPILTNINITNEGKLDLSTLRYYKVPDTKKERLILRRGDILFNWRSGSKEHVGKTVIFNENGMFTFSSFILRFRVNDKVNNTYLFYWLQQMKLNGYFSQYRQQSSVNSVFNASASARIPIALPSAGEQVEISATVAAVDAKLENAIMKRNVLIKTFDSMLHNLMYGKIRVDKVDL